MTSNGVNIARLDRVMIPELVAHPRRLGFCAIAAIAGLIAASHRAPAEPVEQHEPSSSAAVQHPESQAFDSAAVLAWRQLNRLYRPATGLAYATPDYNKLTSWDIGSLIIATMSARIVGLIEDEEYDRRMSRTLTTLTRLPLYRGAVFHRVYLADAARMAGRGGGLSTRGYGYSATDIGRLLAALHLVATTSPKHRTLAQQVVKRMRLDSLVVANGYLHGEMLGRSGKPFRFQEGRIGYEQYAASGFAAWGFNVAPAMNVHANARPIQVEGTPLLEDTRGLDRLVSDPFILLGLESGWPADYKPLADNVLLAQERHAARTGKLSFASEDAVAVKPFYFYYYCIYCTGRSFVVETSEPGVRVNNPRWISTKSVFGWHALANTAYTRKGFSAIARAADARRGWSSGLFEDTLAPTYTFDINTATVILESAAYVRRRGPIIGWRQ